jgi:hypothetical protein
LRYPAGRVDGTDQFDWHFAIVRVSVPVRFYRGNGW